MEIQEKTQVQILQDLIAVLNNRKELIEKLSKKFPALQDGNKSLSQYKTQTKKFIAALLAELSAYGDATGEADPDNDYNNYWKTALKKWDTISQHRAVTILSALEQLLANMYKTILDAPSELPASFKTLLVDQLAELTDK